MRRTATITIALAWLALPASAQAPINGSSLRDGRPAPAPSAGVRMPSRSGATHVIAIHADIGVPGPEGHFLVVSVRDGGIEGCITDAGRRCTRTRRVELTRRDRAELERLLAAARAMPRCEPVGFNEGDPPFTLTVGDHTMRGHLPRAVEDVPARIDEPCEAEHALAWWIAERFGGR